MDFFPDGAFVRLQSLSQHKYLYADPDSLKICLRPLDRVPFETTIWRVHHCHRDRGNVLLMLQAAAYGRYLGAVRGSQGIWWPLQDSYGYNSEDAHELMWQPEALCVSGRRRRSIVLMRNVRYGHLCTHTSSLMRWRVHLISASPTPPALPPAEPVRSPTHTLYIGFSLRFG